MGIAKTGLGFRATVLGLLLMASVAFAWASPSLARAVREPSELEDALWERVNDFRRDPRGEILALGVDMEEWREVYIPSNLPPLAWNEAVREALCLHVEAMVGGSLQGEGLQDRLRRQDGAVPPMEAAVGLFFFRNIQSEEKLLDAFMKQIVEEEVRFMGERPLRLLNESYRDVGVCAFPAQLDALVGEPANGYVFVLLLATMGDRPAFVGRVYADRNANGKWDPGEGVGDVTLVALGPGPLEEEREMYEARTSTPEGIYSLQGDKGLYAFQLWKDGGLIWPGSNAVLEDRNVREDFVVLEP